ncbi:hypothetical protein A2W54_00490 [Candidatus Giovannonibacteria bacterium RIFCSPHIGHO2_02_43_13]|uniref:Uncharacterized protein n=1 Tax=Candidatus Giovannonibacteria bacterium RIFCSPHIGHO2_02_43_13 TaxID=1798330 RepID=A0A1F5WSM0_9BACT|nr:MAG: hypothetical protein A3E06_03500 [Candidatus Giovannonibacteria bacterium RIFCSPHIGHO2_12_FULL_44_42]OGF78620.1 MAG: hypothetical protein A2W54_00490 [Candidatus Giovannonibacteria bacterium RIFCSPHIGHO2_02_43_13]OGF89818.1 MAG: hypothetical protein A3I94_01085 [Candidatus Giovannonibacteria bacterium RIFCSPLOWO2_02_FULL_43_54]OGF97142.1 MAG: hypothetical protein A3H08_03310 [Candidatus Giovannonibacteria bacterium RIFCSPLOWO2_12_FULL_44_32]
MNTLRFDKAACRGRFGNLVETDGEEAKARPARYSFVPGMAVRGGKAVVCDSPTEPSWIDVLTKQFAETGNQFELLWWAVSLRIALDPDEDAIDGFCFALLHDLLDSRIDRKAGTRYDHVVINGQIKRIPRQLTDEERFPFLAEMAKAAAKSEADQKNFVQFQRAVNENKYGNLGLPAL